MTDLWLCVPVICGRLYLRDTLHVVRLVGNNCSRNKIVTSIFGDARTEVEGGGEVGVGLQRKHAHTQQSALSLPHTHRHTSSPGCSAGDPSLTHAASPHTLHHVPGYVAMQSRGLGCLGIGSAVGPTVGRWGRPHTRTHTHPHVLGAHGAVLATPRSRMQHPPYATTCAWLRGHAVLGPGLAGPVSGVRRGPRCTGSSGWPQPFKLQKTTLIVGATRAVANHRVHPLCSSLPPAKI